MDKIDQKLLVLLLQDSRLSTTQLAKQARISRDVAEYRLLRFEKQHIIRNYVTQIDSTKLGYSSALFFVNIKASVEKEFIAFIHTLPYVSWSGVQMGLWSVGMAIYGRSTSEIEERFQFIYQKYKDSISKHMFEFYKNTEFYMEKFFGKHFVKPNVSYSSHTVDAIDLQILQLLSKNARVKMTSISKTVGLSAVAVANRVRMLEKSGYITGYTVFLNVRKLGKILFTFFVRNKSYSQRKRLFSYLQSHPRVSLLLDYIGDPFIEFGVFATDPYEIRSVILEIQESFPDNELIDFFLTQDDFISYGAPDCVFG